MLLLLQIVLLIRKYTRWPYHMEYIDLFRLFSRTSSNLFLVPRISRISTDFVTWHSLSYLIRVIRVICGLYYLQLFLSHGFRLLASFVLLICVIRVICGLYSFHLFWSHRFHRFSQISTDFVSWHSLS